jgi:hypothetical protein
MKITVFWVVGPCSAIALMKAASTSETSINFYQTTRRNNPEDSHLLVLVRFGRNLASVAVKMLSCVIYFICLLNSETCFK